MAEEKKKGAPKPAAPSGGIGTEGEIFFAIIISLAILFIILPTVLDFFHINFSFGGSWRGAWESFVRAFSALFSTVLTVSLFACLVLVLAYVYAKFRFQEISDHYTAKLKKADNPDDKPSFKKPTPHVPVQGETHIAQIALPVHPRWQKIEANMQSSNSSDWRLAILEADIMLYDMLDQMGYFGQTVAEKLKQVNADSFSTLQDAWQAHKVRNIIAHEGADFELGRSQAEHTIKSYKKVFDEFYFI